MTLLEHPSFQKSTNDRKPPAWIHAGFSTLSRLSPAAAGWLAVRIFRSARRFALPEREAAWIERATPLAIPYAGEMLPGWSWGSGPTVLLVHGWEGRGSQLAAFAEPLAAAGLRVVTFDAPGHGTATGRGSSLPDFTTAIQSAAAAVGPLAAVVAHSFGAAGTGRALLGGLNAERLVFVSAPYDLDLYLHWFARFLGLSERGRLNMVRRLESSFAVDWPEARFATTRPADERPLLVIHDRDDRDTPIEGGRKIAAAWPHSRFVETRGLGHRRILRDPQVVSEVVEFLRPLAAAATGAGRAAG